MYLYLSINNFQSIGSVLSALKLFNLICTILFERFYLYNYKVVNEHNYTTIIFLIIIIIIFMIYLFFSINWMPSNCSNCFGKYLRCPRSKNDTLHGFLYLYRCVSIQRFIHYYKYIPLIISIPLYPNILYTYTYMYIFI